MDNLDLPNKNSKSNAINLTKRKFIIDMKKQNVNMERFLDKNQVNKLLELKYSNNNVVLDDSVKQSEEKRILEETNQLNNLMLFLRDKLPSKIVSILKNPSELNKFTNSIQAMPQLSIINSKTISISLKDPILNIYVQNLINSSRIDFSLFYYGNQDDIFHEIYKSFIKSDDTVLIKYIDEFQSNNKLHDLFIKLASTSLSKMYENNREPQSRKDWIRVTKEEFDSSEYEEIKTHILQYKFNHSDYYNKEDSSSQKIGEHYRQIIDKLYPGIDISPYKIEICNYMKFEEICEYLYNEKKLGNNIEDKCREIIKEIESKFINEYITIFKYYLHYLNFNYVKTSGGKININSNKIKTNTLEHIKKYLKIINDILKTIIKEEKFDKVIDEIKIEYKNKIKKDNGFVSGFLLSTLYNFNKTDKYNIPSKYLDNPHFRNRKSFRNLKLNNSNSISEDYIDKYNIYYHFKKKEILYIQNTDLIRNFEGYLDSNDNDKDHIRLVLTKKHLQNLHNVYKEYFKRVIEIIQTLIQNYELSQQKYLYLLSLVIIHDKQSYEYNKELDIKKKFNKYLKSENLQTSTDIIITSKAYFSKRLFELNEQLLRLIEDKINLTDRYNRFITEYSLWIIRIIQYISTYPNDSKQIYHFEKILQMFMSETDIKNWYNSCVKNNLYYWLPVSYKGNSNYSFFVNLITNDKSYKIKSNDLIIVKYKKSHTRNGDDEIYSWNNNRHNILVDNSYDRILIFIKKYIKCNASMDINDFSVIKSLITRCDKKKSNHNRIIQEKMKFIHQFNKTSKVSTELSELNKELALSEEIEQDCKHLISYHQIIKEIIKTKYPFKINNNDNLSGLNSVVQKYQKQLYNQIPK